MARTLENCDGFDWDEGNSDKNWHLHSVTDGESEEIFFNQPLIVVSDQTQQSKESRHRALGRTDSDRKLFVAFTIRGNKIRVISARDMTASEERRYAEKVKRDPGI
jgi:uncharacterized DUF497 family protein